MTYLMSEGNIWVTIIVVLAPLEVGILYLVSQTPKLETSSYTLSANPCSNQLSLHGLSPPVPPQISPPLARANPHGALEVVVKMRVRWIK